MKISAAFMCDKSSSVLLHLKQLKSPLEGGYGSPAGRFCNPISQTVSLVSRRVVGKETGEKACDGDSDQRPCEVAGRDDQRHDIGSDKAYNC